MKKKLLALLLTCGLACTATTAFATAEQIIINGEIAEIPAEMGSIKERDDRTFVPIRFVMEYLKYNVDYTSTTVNGVAQESVTVTDNNNTSYLMLRDSKQLYVLPGIGGGVGGPINMDTAAFIDDTEDRFYIPIRFLAEAIGYNVGWDEATQTVTLNKAE